MAHIVHREHAERPRNVESDQVIASEALVEGIVRLREQHRKTRGAIQDLIGLARHAQTIAVTLKGENDAVERCIEEFVVGQHAAERIVIRMRNEARTARTTRTARTSRQASA